MLVFIAPSVANQKFRICALCWTGFSQFLCTRAVKTDLMKRNPNWFCFFFHMPSLKSRNLCRNSLWNQMRLLWHQCFMWWTANVSNWPGWWFCNESLISDRVLIGQLYANRKSGWILCQHFETHGLRKKWDKKYIAMTTYEISAYDKSWKWQSLYSWQKLSDHKKSSQQNDAVSTSKSAGHNGEIMSEFTILQKRLNKHSI